MISAVAYFDSTLECLLSIIYGAQSKKQIPTEGCLIFIVERLCYVLRSAAVCGDEKNKEV